MPIIRVAVMLVGLLSATFANAAAQRTFVASTGNDANTALNCSIVNPCRGFAAAIGVTGAKGEVIVLDSGGYGPIPSITKSITIAAPAGIYAGISVFSGDGIAINAGVTDTVVLRGLTINGQGGANGITIADALTVHVENCVIANMVGIGINHLKGTLEVKDTIVRNNGNVGVYVVGPAQANLDHVRLEANNTGLAAEFGGIVAMQDGVVTGSPNIRVVTISSPTTSSNVTITRSLISSNAYGIYVDGSDASAGLASAKVAISESAISGNGVGVHVLGSSLFVQCASVQLKHNLVTANGTGIELFVGAEAIVEGNNISRNVGRKDLTADSTSIVLTLKTSMVDRAVVDGSVLLQVPF